MKRLLGLLLVMGIVGCGGGSEAPPAGDEALPATPNNPQAKVDEPPAQVVDVDPSVESPNASPKTPADTVDDTPTQVADADPVNSLKKLGARIKQDDQRNIVELSLMFNSRITDARLVHLEGLPGLQTLKISQCRQITDAGLVHLKRTTKLRSLYLTAIEITDAGLVHLRG